ncbi:MAG TPA: chalcone isomerase family protein [Polyangia bacterium]|nr:chalcone isomerase family protein [Polyangia bacterium]
MRHSFGASIAAAALALVLWAAPARAREVEGIVMPDQVEVAGKTLALNGVGLRTKLFVKVYVAGLYLSARTRDADAAISADQPKRIELALLRDLSRDKMESSLRSGFEDNAGPRLAALRDRLARFAALLRDGKKGDRLILTYEPGRGTTVASAHGKPATIEGKDFADALFSVWLGPHPVDSGLKQALLGR